MRPYETMIIFDAELEEPAISGVLERAMEVLRTSGGTPGSVERWGRRAFAYEMKKRREGYYVLAGFSADPKGSAELDRFLTLADEVLRHKIIRLPDRRLAATRRAGAPASAASGTD
ncbi:MAG TPA: 30S ribosomal protein S6 [Acidimicrobiales bacterium]|nr:30S ribosomal protein S6 [Acidimicrobiales bacterium]